jgi:hypothetical protein
MNALVVISICIFVAYGNPAKAQFGGFSLPSAGGAALNAIAEQLKLRAISAILASISNSAFEEGKLILAKQQWACQKLAEAEEILEALSQAKISEKVAGIKIQLFCEMTDSMPSEDLAPLDEQDDSGSEP